MADSSTSTICPTIFTCAVAVRRWWWWKVGVVIVAYEVSQSIIGPWLQQHAGMHAQPCPALPTDLVDLHAVDAEVVVRLVLRRLEHLRHRHGHERLLVAVHLHGTARQRQQQRARRFVWG